MSEGLFIVSSFGSMSRPLKIRRSYTAGAIEKPLVEMPLSFDTPGVVIVSEVANNIIAFSNGAQRVFGVEVNLKPLPDIDEFKSQKVRLQEVLSSKLAGLKQEKEFMTGLVQLKVYVQYKTPPLRNPHEFSGYCEYGDGATDLLQFIVTALEGVFYGSANQIVKVEFSKRYGDNDKTYIYIAEFERC